VTGQPRPLVVCLVGTDHHPFERLVSWCDALATSRPDIDVLVQHGQSAPPRVAEGRAFLPRQDLVALLRRAWVAVSHGGPGVISEITAAGLRPLAVPRDPARGEHVDGHQIRFLDAMGRRGLVDVVADQELFLTSVARRLTQPREQWVDRVAAEARVLATVRRFADLIEPLYARPSPAEPSPAEPSQPPPVPPSPRR
jgi:UDP-N-acetylglucosamine transferase subunit ALG13